MDKFKHMQPGFPYLDNVNVYAYTNNYDYTKWGIGTTIRVLHVPWDRDYSNVVKFENDAARDQWVKEHTSEIYKLDTAINMQPDGSIKLPVPFDVLAKCNYIVVDYAYPELTFEDPDRISSMGYFIDDVMQLAPSTTQARVYIDYWFTYINDIVVTYMDLERGHAPLAATSATWYLEDPINRNDLLLTPDVNFSSNNRGRVKSIADWVANSGTAYAVFACTGNVGSAYWGTNGNRNMQTPGIAAGQVNGILSGLDYIAVALSDLNSFIVEVNQKRPHFLQTVQAMFYVPGQLVTLSDAFRWDNFNTDLYWVSSTPKNFFLAELDKTMFGYDTRYSELAKLYTAPYAHLEITDEKGNVSEIEIENTTGDLSINATLNLVHPFVGCDVHMMGIGDPGVEATGYGWNSNRFFTHGGDWYSLLKRYNFPSFIVSQSQNDRAQFDRFFTNAQAVNDYTTSYNNTIEQYTASYNNAVASNLTSYNNTIASNTTSYNNALSSNSTNLDNTLLSNATASANNSDNYTTAYDISNNNNYTARSDMDAQLLLSRLIFQEGLGQNIVTTLQNGISSVASGGASVGSIANTAAQMIAYPFIISSNATIQAGTENNITGAANRHYGNTDDGSAEDGNIMYAAKQQRRNAIIVNTRTKDNADLNARRTKNNADATALASKNTSDANALASKNTSDENAARTQAAASVVNVRNRNNAMAAIDNGNRAQGVQAPAVYGSNANAESASSKPLGFFVNVVTQAKGAIKAAGDQFLRYGYELEQAWEPVSLQVMKHFTYWKTRDIWIDGRGETVEAASETIRAIFNSGVTVWSDPAKIGRVSIYDNMGE